MVGYAEIVYSLHARVRMEERSIPDQVVIDVLAAPDRGDRDGDELVAERVLADGKPWKVVYVEEQRCSDRIARIVTVHRIRGLRVS